VPISSILFVGEAVTDGIYISDEDTTPGFRFERRIVDPEGWAEEVARLGPGLIVSPGGSMANACMAARAVLPAPWPIVFWVTRSGPRARARFPLHWPGYNTCVEQLSAVAVRVIGYSAAETLPEWPLALIRLGTDRAVRKITAAKIIGADDIRAAPHSPVVPVATLVVRSDDWSRVPVAAVDGSTRVCILACDDTGPEDLDPILAGAALSRERWLFCRSAVAERLNFAITLGPEWNVVITNGAHPCDVWQNGQRQSFNVPPFDMPPEGSDLGAGDAYMGAFVAVLSSGGTVERAHQTGCAGAHRAMRSCSATHRPTMDLNALFPLRIDRWSPRDDEGTIRAALRCVPGVSLLSGGQTGVDWLIGEAAIAEGLLVQGLFPAGLRQEDRNAGPGDFNGWGVVRELGSRSFRYRTWALAYMADVVVMVDLVGGEGSGATIEAAEYFARPVLDASAASEKELADFLAEFEPRIVLVAGSRGSLLRAAGQYRLAREVTQAVARAVRRENARRFCDGGSPNHTSLMGTLVVPARVLALPAVRELLDSVRVRRVVHLKTGRDCAGALEARVADAAITWPALLGAPAAYRIHPLGTHPVSYGFTANSREEPAGPWGVQYPHVYTRTFQPPAGERFVAGITGSAEQWIAGGLIDLAFDSKFTGRSAADLGLSHYPTTWDCLSFCVRPPSASVSGVAGQVTQNGKDEGVAGPLWT